MVIVRLQIVIGMEAIVILHVKLLDAVIHIALVEVAAEVILAVPGIILVI